MPSVSSSKNLSKPALAAGIGLLFSFFRLLMLFTFPVERLNSYYVSSLLTLCPYLQIHIHKVIEKELFYCTKP